jgi:hypothetical protein
MKIIDLFDLMSAHSHSIDDYDIGIIPFITSSEINNGIIKFVEPLNGDKLFEGKSICISGLGFATLQLNKYLPKGNGGDSATILMPKSDMSFTEMLFYTVQFNMLHKWRFSFGRKCNIKRIEYLTFSNKFNDFKYEESTLLSIKKQLTNKLNELNLFGNM